MCAWAFLCVRSAICDLRSVACGLWLVDSCRPQGACGQFRLLDALGRSADKNTSLNNRKTKNNVSHVGGVSWLFLFAYRIVCRETSNGQYIYFGKVVFGFFL